MLICISALLLSLFPITSFSSATEARCPNGYHKSPSGDCEKVTHSGGLPRCPDGYHRSPDGDCERVSSGDTNSDGSSRSDNDDNEDINERDFTSQQDDDKDVEDSTSSLVPEPCLSIISTSIYRNELLSPPLHIFRL
jgi:hypothetical protein